MKTLRVKHLLLFVGVLFIGSSCIKINECGECFTPPPQLSFKVIDAESGDNLYTDLTYSHSDLKLFYITDNDSTFLNVDLFQIADQWIISSREMSWISLSNEGETFYLELNPHTVETIYLKIISVTENCCTYHPIDDLTINGENAEIETYTNYILIKKQVSKSVDR